MNGSGFPGASPLGRMYPTAHMLDEDTILFIGGSGVDEGPRTFTLSLSTGQCEPYFTDGQELDCIQHTSVRCGDFIYILGNARSAEGSLLQLDLSTKCLRNIPCDIPRNLHSHTSVLLHSAAGEPIIYTFGGAERQHTLGKLYAFEVGKNRWRRVTPRTTGPPSRLYHAACAVRDRYMYIYGGAPDNKTTSPEDVVYDDLWRYDAWENVWERVEQLGNVPSKRGSTSLLFSDPYLYMLGGFDGTNGLDDFYRFDVDTHLWRRLEHAPEGGRWAYAHCAGRLVDQDLGSSREVFFYIGGLGLSDYFLPSAESIASLLTTDILQFTPEEITLKHLAARFIAKNDIPFFGA